MARGNGRLYVVGSANMDLVVRAPRLPTAGATVVGADLVQIAGGKGANQAVAAARLGAPVSFVGNVGADAFGTQLQAALAEAEVDLTQLTVVAGRPSGVALIVVDTLGENLIAVGSGANAALSKLQVEQALRSLGPADVVLVQLEVPLEAVEHACRLARAAAARVVLNAAPADNQSVRLLGLVSVLIVNAGEAADLSQRVSPEDAARELLARGPGVVIVTLGGDGLLLASDSDVHRIAAHKVDVVDTTAAGDAFCGAFAAALLEGQEPDAAAQFASVAAALATTKLGAQPSLPWRTDVNAGLIGLARRPG